MRPLNRMNPTRHTRISRLATAGMAATTATVLAAVLSPTAHADTRPTRATAVANASRALTAHATALGLTTTQTAKVRDVVIDKDGTQHVRYDRTYRELPVLGGDFVVHLTPNGAYRSANRATESTIALPSITPTALLPDVTISVTS